MLDYNRGNAKYDDPIGNQSPRPSGPKPEHEKENEKPTLVAPPPQSHQGKNQGCHPVESCFMTSGKQSTQARISDYFRPPVRSHAIHDQGGLETAHQRDGRGTSSRVDSDSARDTVSGAERRDLTWPEDPKPTLGGNESCFQEKDRIAEVHSRAPGTQDHRQRNGGSLTDHGSPKDHGDDTTTGIRQDGVWKTCQQDIPGGPRVRPVICGLVPPNQSRRGDMLADEAIPQVGDTTSSHSRECPRELHPEEDSASQGKILESFTQKKNMTSPEAPGYNKPEAASAPSSGTEGSFIHIPMDTSVTAADAEELLSDLDVQIRELEHQKAMVRKSTSKKEEAKTQKTGESSRTQT